MSRLACLLVIALSLFGFGAGTAHAADVSAQIIVTKLTMTDADGNPVGGTAGWDSNSACINFDGKWPAGAPAGSTWTLNLPTHVENWPATIVDPTGFVTVAITGDLASGFRPYIP